MGYWYRDREPVLASAVALRDSAGVRIVESSAPQWEPNERWRIADSPSMSIGTIEGPRQQQLTNVRAVVELSDGTIVVANGGTLELRSYDVKGRFQWASGRRGQGPGDYFTLVRPTRYPGDSIVVYDAGLRRYSLIGRLSLSNPGSSPSDRLRCA